METQTTTDMEHLVTGETFVINPTQELLTSISNLEVDVGEGEKINVLISESDFNSVDRNLLVSSRLKEMQSSDEIAFRELTEKMQSNLFVSEDIVGVVIASFSSEFVISVDVSYAELDSISIVSELWDKGGSFEFISPERSFVQGKMVELESEEFYDSFVSALEVIERDAVSVPERSRYSDRWHIYAALVIAGSMTETTVKNIGRVAELAELGSRSTISRIKNEIEEHGYIETTTTSTNRGRPPMLVSQSGLYKGKSVEEFTQTVFDTIKLKELDPDDSATEAVESNVSDREHGGSDDETEEQENSDDSNISEEEK